MADDASNDTPTLRGKRAWLITDGKAGMMTHVRGLAEALGVVAENRIVDPKGAYKFFSPYGPAPKAEMFGPEGLFKPPFPAIAIASGRLAIPYLRALKKAAGHRIFTVYMQDPRTGAKTADMIWVPAHDRLRGTNVIVTLTSPHGFSAARISELRKTVPDDIAALPHPRVTVVLGGKNKVYRFSEEADRRFAASLGALAKAGCSFMITPSRRTHPELLRLVDEATRGAPRILWDGTGENPYPQFLAQADALVVTADSVNMCGEACATGRPVYVFTPDGGSKKFGRFHAALREYGAVRELSETIRALETWDYVPLDAASVVAREVESRWAKRARMLGGCDGGAEC